MRLFLILLGIIVYIDCSCQIDTLLIKQNARLLLNNYYGVAPLSVSGEIYLTSDQLQFSPKRYRNERYDMHTPLVKNIVIPYDSMIRIKRSSQLTCGLEVRTKKIIYQIDLASSLQKPRKKKLREIVTLVKDLMEK